jgi:hypothetical protein
MLGWLQAIRAGELPPPIATAGPALVEIEEEASIAERAAIRSAIEEEIAAGADWKGVLRILDERKPKP